ncbi:MAG: FKBP-type peptidyl-prolyl cis-trans isomerase [Pseudomonadota bacterium]
MKYFVSCFSLAVFLAVPTYAAKPPEKPGSDDEKVSYFFGRNISQNLQNQGIDISVDYVVQGIRDGLSGADSMLTDDEIKTALMAVRQRLEAEQQKIADGNKAKGEAFLNENKGKDGVKTLPSGLQYKVLKAGTGKSPKAESKVQTHYRGTLIDGTEFDSSYSRDQPTEFQVNGVIPGWTEALQLMKEGGKWQLFIPSDLAYGPNGAGGSIGPHEALIFEVELLKVLD